MIEDVNFATPSGFELPAILNHPSGSDTPFVLGHGSGSTIHVPLMAAFSEALSPVKIATLRFEYPYSNDPDFVPFSDMPVDDDEVLIETVKAALEFGMHKCPDLKPLVGGHSISGLMATYADAEAALPAAGIICMGFPRKGDPGRSQHLASTTAPILLVQGTNDTLGRPREIEEMVSALGARVKLNWIENATHGFDVEGRELSQISVEIAGAVRQFATQI